MEVQISVTAGLKSKIIRSIKLDVPKSSGGTDSEDLSAANPIKTQLVLMSASRQTITGRSCAVITEQIKWAVVNIVRTRKGAVLLSSACYGIDYDVDPRSISVQYKHDLCLVA